MHPQTDAASASLLFACDKGLSWIENALNGVAAATIFIVMIATTLQIGARLMGAPVPGFLEVSEQSIAIFAFLGAAYGQRLGAHIRMELFVRFVKGRARWLLEMSTTLIALFVIAMLIPYSVGFFLNAFIIGDTTLDYGIPTWPSKLLVPIALSIWFARLSVEAVGFARLAIWPDAEPIGVPLLKSVAAAAKDEMTEAFGRDDVAAGSKDHVQ